MKGTAYYDKNKRIVAIRIVANDLQDMEILQEIAELFKKHAVPDMKVQEANNVI